MRKPMMLTLFLLCLSMTMPLFGQTGKPTDIAADTTQAAALMKAAQVLFDSLKHDAALEKMEQAATLYERSLGTESREFANFLYRKAICIYKKGDYPRASELFQTSLDIQIKVLGEQTIDVGRSYNGLGVILMENGKYELAIENYLKSLNILFKILGPEDIELVAPYDNLGKVYLKKRDFALSAENFHKALDIRLKRFGADHPVVAKSYLGLGELESLRGNFKQVVDYNQKALSTFSKSGMPEPMDAIMVYNNIGNAYRLSSEYDEALAYYDKSLSVCIAHFGSDHTNVGVLYNNIGNIYMAKSNYDLALKCYQNVLAIFQKNLTPDNPNLAGIYNNIGEIYRNKGNTDKALEYYQKALAVFQKRSTKENSSVASINANQAIVYAQKGEYDKSLELLQRALDIQIEALGVKHPDVLSKYLNIGEVYRRKGEYDNALAFFDKVIAQENELTGEGQEKVAVAYHNSGAALALKGDYIQALAYFQKGLKIWEQVYGKHHVGVSESYYNLAVCHKFFKDFPASEAHIAYAFQALSYNGVASLPKVESVLQLLQILMLKGVLFRGWYLHDGQLDHLYTARQAFVEAHVAIKYQHNTFQNPGAKYTLAKEVAPLYEAAIATNYLLRQRTDSLHYAVEAFDYAEKTKSHILYGAMQESHALRFAGLPDSLLQQEQKLRIDITYQEKKRQAQFAWGLTTTDSAFVAISAKLFDLNQQYEALKKRFERDFPKYYGLRYDLSTASVREVQEELLQPGQTLLEYLLGDSSLFVFVIGKATFHIEKIKIDFPLNAWVTDLRNAMTTERNTGAALYCERAHQLYQKLIVPVKDRLTSDVVIIPDGVLNYLPFEALLTQMPEKPARFRNHNYLLDDHRISYCYSATLLREMQEKRQQKMPAEPLLAIAPYYSGDTVLLAEMHGLTPRKKRRTLRHSGGEVYGIRRIMGGDVLYGEAATKEHFQQIAERYRILHLATHGQANEQAGDYSLVAFAEPVDSTTADNLLYVRDIYNLSLNADLVTLSACETGIGKLHRGEGVISVARAFAFAGAGSIVTSLWDVDDEQTKELMLLFYKELRKGSTKSEALQTAKRTLAKQPGSHPFFWAAFIGIGDMRPI